MHIPVLIEPVANQGYRARSGEPLAAAAEGTTTEEAVRNLQTLLEQRLAQGTRLIELNIPTTENPWVQYAGMFKDNTLFDEVVDIMAQQRQLTERIRITYEPGYFLLGYGYTDALSAGPSGCLPTLCGSADRIPATSNACLT